MRKKRHTSKTPPSWSLGGTTKSKRHTNLCPSPLWVRAVLGGAGMPGNTCGEQQQRHHTAQMAVMGARAQWIRGTCRESGRAGRSAGARAGARVPVRRREPDADERQPQVRPFATPHACLLNGLCLLTGTLPPWRHESPPRMTPAPPIMLAVFSRAPYVSMPVDAQLDAQFSSCFHACRCTHF